MQGAVAKSEPTYRA